MKNYKILAFGFLAFFGYASAAAIPFVETVAPTTDPSFKMMAMPPYETSEKVYKFDEKSATNMLNKKSSLMKINCNSSSILNDFGLSQKGSKIFTLGVNQADFDYTFDLRSCSVRGNKINYFYSNKPLTESQAMAYAKSFIKSDFLVKKLYLQYGDPIIINKNSNNPMPYLMKAESNQSVGDDMSGIEIDTTDTGDIDIAPEYVSYSILFPYKINNSAVYNSYGTKAGITLEVSADGVLSMNAQLMPFKGAVRNAEKLTGSNLISFIKKGGNNQYRGKDKEISLKTPEKVLVMFNLWRNNVNELYLSSGIKFTSDSKSDQYPLQPYEMIISDYKIGNSSLTY